MIKKPRIIFAGTPEFAAAYLRQLIDADYLPVAVYTQPDRKAGRGKKLLASAVKQLALEHQLPVFQPDDFKNNETIEQFKQLQPDLLIVVAYGLLLPQAVLDTPQKGCINAHASLLPRWRGAAPIQRAIEAGDEKTGVCLMQMELGLDTGGVLAKTEVAIDNATSAELHQQLATAGAQLLIEKLPAILTAKITPIPQDEALVSYAHKLNKQQAKIDWTLSAIALERQIRAFNSWPVSYFQFKGKPIRVWQAEVVCQSVDAQPGTVIAFSSEGLKVTTAEGALNITQLQMPGKKTLSIQQLQLGQPQLFKLGEKLL